MSNDTNVQLLHLSWDEVQELSELLALKISSNGFIPDIIVAVSRGGYAPARILCDQLSVSRLTSLQVEYYKGINQVNKEPIISFPLNAIVKELRVLLVDDVSDSGVSLKLAINHIYEREVKEFKTATLHIKPWTSLYPDFYAEKVNQWIVYPWELIEGMNAMATKLLSMNILESDIPKKLIDLGFNKKYFDKLILRR